MARLLRQMLRRRLVLVALGSLGAASTAAAQVCAQMGNLAIESSQRSQLTFNINYGLVKETTASYFQSSCLNRQRTRAFNLLSPVTGRAPAEFELGLTR